MALGPRYYDPANRESDFAAAVGGALSGFTGAQDFVAKRRQQAQAEEDRRRAIDRQAQQDAEHDYEQGISVAPNGATPAATPAAPSTPMSEQPGVSGRMPFDETPSFGKSGGDVAPNVGTALASAVGAQLAGTTPTAPATQPPAQQPTASTATAAVPPQQPQGGIRQRVGSILGRIGDQVSTGGYHGYTPPTYSVTRTGPSMREREEGVRQSGENARELGREGSAQTIAKGNNATAIEVARINAASREAAAAARAQNDQRLKVAMGAVANQVTETEKAIKRLQDEYDRSEPSLVDNAQAKTQKQERQRRLQVQIDRLNQQHSSLMAQQQNMMLAAAMGQPDLAGFVAPATPYSDPNDETQMSDADLWEKKRQEGMTQEQATAYVRSRKRGP